MYMAAASSSSLPESVSWERQRVMIIEELVQGRESATKLRAWLAGDGEESASEISAEDLVSKIMKSFTNPLLMLYQNDPAKNDNKSSSAVDSQCLDGRKSEDSGESNCRSVSTPARDLKERRGCYKRRKTSNTIRETPNFIDDGHAWRKYGQKKILKSEHPRNYFRCTHKYDQQCQATKHVQMIQEEPPMYRTTYYGSHTCRNLISAPELVLNCTSPTQNSSVLLSFNGGENALNNLAAGEHPFFSSSLATTTTTPVKQEFKDEILAVDPYGNSIMSVAHNGSPVSSDYIVLPHDHDDHDLRAAFDQSPGHMTVLSSNLESDIHGDVISGVIDMESFEDDVLQHMNF